jgi:peptidoglycan/LPS O-acetylase OafA/YrhL
VVVHHSLLVSPSLANAYAYEGIPAPAGSWSWWLSYTPLHLVWAGGEAVLVFFVLSGLVLAMPAARGAIIDWRAYYPQRLLRLYLPTIAAAVFAYALIRAVSRKPIPHASWWLSAHPATASVTDVLSDASILRGTVFVNPAFWSLQWEVVFSLLLPLFLILLVRVRRWPLARVVALLGLIALGDITGHASLRYLPIFGLGVVMAQQIKELDRLGQRFNGYHVAQRAAVVAGALLLVVSQWWLIALHHGGIDRNTGAVVGACLVVWLFACTASSTRLGTRSGVAWLGKRSFSLYLVHEPIVVTIAYLLHGRPNVIAVLALSLPLSLFAAELFGRAVEMPSHRLSREVGERIRASHGSQRAARP